MEQRSGPPLIFDQPVVLTYWATDGETFPGRFVDHAQDGIKIKLERSLDRGGILKLEAGDHLVLAEVRDCQADDSGFSAGLGILACVEKAELSGWTLPEGEA